MEDSSNWFMSIWNLESDDLDCTNLESDDLDEHMEGSNGTGEESDDLDEHLEDTKGIEEETLYDCTFQCKFRQANKLFAFGTLPFKANGTGPRQKNDFDCGVYVIRNMQKYGTDWAAKYNSEIERASLVVECLRHPKNEVVDLHVRVDRCLARNTGK
ncbi:hypothetical protein ACLB2K_056300 [Fragaria x ananassa]